MGFRKLLAYQKGFTQAYRIFQHSKLFPAEEQYSLTTQIRRSSRSVCANIAEAYRKRNYPAHFVSKITDAEMENSETAFWLEFAKACEYMTKDQMEEIMLINSEVGKLLNYMRRNPHKFE